nr:unnamed protein product [Callosobruchus analis]
MGKLLIDQRKACILKLKLASRYLNL